MDKADFIAKAPRYYALAVLIQLFSSKRPITRFEVINEFAYFDDEIGDVCQRIEPGALFEAAIKLLVAEKLVTVLVDDFAPELIIASDILSVILTDGFTELSPLWDKYLRAGVKGDDWLKYGLDTIKQESERLNIQASDYENPEAEWSPIPVDRDQPETQILIDAVADAAEKLRADNGYAATKPEERNYVVDGLAIFLKRMRESASISIPYIRQYAIGPLAKAGKSLGRSATGVAVDVAKMKLRDWLLKLERFLFDLNRIWDSATRR